MGSWKKAAFLPLAISISISISALPFLIPLTAIAVRDHCDPSNLPDPLTLRADKLTILMNGFSERRLPLLRTLATAYSTHPLVAAVLILWGNPSTPAKTLTKALIPTFPNPAAAAISVLRQPTASLNARFLPRREIRTRAVAVCDDDVEIDPRSLTFAFAVWSGHQDRIVGFFARSHDLDLEAKSWIYTVHPERYSIVLTKFMILKSDYLRGYSCGDNATAAAREVVDRTRNCEDILMNMVVAVAAGKGPVLVGGRRVRDWGDTRNDGGGAEEAENRGVSGVGLSAVEGHRSRRGFCIREFHRVMGRMPLRYSYGKVVEGVREQGLCKKGGKLVFCDRVG